MDGHVKSQRPSVKVKHPPPQEVIEISLFDRFGWSPKDLDDLDYNRLQRIMVVLNQMEKSEEAARAMGP